MNKFMKIAIKEAEKGIELSHGGPFGAVIVRNGRVIAKGHNRVLNNIDPTCHGEIDAIRKACKKLKTHDLSGCEIYTTGYPCLMCYGAILWANISKVYYGCNVLDAQKIGFRDNKFEKNFISKGKILCEEIGRDECVKLFKKYKMIEDKENY